MTKKGDTWNESTTYRDPFSLRTVRKVTAGGVESQLPGSAFHEELQCLMS